MTRLAPLLFLAPVALVTGCSERGLETEGKSRFEIVASADAERAFVLDTVTGCVELVERASDGKFVKQPLRYPNSITDDACFVMPIPGPDSWHIRQKMKQ